MPGYALLAPIPAEHLEGAIELLKTKDFVLFGSEAYETFLKTETGAKVLIYASHKNAEPIASYRAVYRDIVKDLAEMQRLEKEGYRPPTTVGEKWAFYWKVSDIEKLADPIPLSDLQLATGGYFDKGYPWGPVHVLN